VEAKYRLASLKAEGFRGICHPIDLSFHPRATVIVAPNGCGKTSILGAIEWALFGELPYQPRENATNDEIVNLHHHPQEAQVRVSLDNGVDTFDVSRTKRVGRRATELAAVFAGLRNFVGDGASEACFQHLGLTLDDFYRAVYLHQESIRGLLLDEPRVRNEALDRLFGVNKLRDILRMLSVKPATDAIGELQATKGRAAAKLQGAIGEVNAQYERALQDASREGLPADDLSPTLAASLVGDVAGRLSSAARLVGYPDVVTFPTADAPEELDRVATRARELVRSIRRKGTELQGGTASATQLGALEGSRATLSGAQTLVGTAGTELADAVGRLGGMEALSSEMEGVHETLSRLQREWDEVTANQRLNAEAISYLQHASAATECPVCGQPITAHDLLARLQEGLEDQLRIRLQAIEEARAAAKADLARLETAQGEIQRKQKALASAQDALRLAEGGALASLDTSVEASALHAALEAKIVQVREAGTRAAEAREAAETHLAAAESVIDRIRVIVRVLRSALERNQALGRLGAMDSSESTADLQMAALGSLAADIQTVAAAVQTVASDTARTALDVSGDDYGRFYATLCAHPYFDRLRISVEEQRVNGVDRNNYVIRTHSSLDGEASLASSRLSTAQMNCVALSVYLALATRLEHHLGFVILDDPSQSLDLEHKQALVQVLDELDPRLQLLIATQDLELGDMLSRRWPGDASTRYGLNWSPDHGAELVEADG
jgi:exonuclease SbcC